MTGSLGTVADPPTPVALVLAPFVSVVSGPVVAAELVAPLPPVVLERPPALVAADADEEDVLLGPVLLELALAVASVTEVVAVALLLATVLLPVTDELAWVLLASTVPVVEGAESLGAASLHAATSPTTMQLTKEWGDRGILKAHGSHGVPSHANTKFSRK